MLRRCLEHDQHTVTLVRDGPTAIEQWRRCEPDLVILDVLIPETNGLEVCRIFRRESDVLILILTARTDEADLLRGLDLGADDYMIKPYSPRELTARIRNLLRRASRPVESGDGVLRV